jgi:hypothetical protein
MSNELLEELQLNLEAAREGMNTGDIEAAVSAIDTYYIKKLIAGLRAVEYLIDATNGVEGLYTDRFITPWKTMRTGGLYESVLFAFDDALEIAKQIEEEK